MQTCSHKLHLLKGGKPVPSSCHSIHLPPRQAPIPSCRDCPPSNPGPDLIIVFECSPFHSVISTSKTPFLSILTAPVVWGFLTSAQTNAFPSFLSLPFHLSYVVLPDKPPVAQIWPAPLLHRILGCFMYHCRISPAGPQHFQQHLFVPLFGIYKLLEERELVLPSSYPQSTSLDSHCTPNN